MLARRWTYRTSRAWAVAWKRSATARHYGLDMLLRHLRELTPAERAAPESKLPPDVLQALRKYVDELS